MKTISNNQTIKSEENNFSHFVFPAYTYSLFTIYDLRCQEGAHMIASITGVGWVDTESMGWGRRHERNPSGEGTLPKVTGRMIFGKGLPHFGRLDTYSKIGIAAIAFALKDAQRFEWQEKRSIGVIASTTCGCLERDMEYIETMLPQGGRLASPNLFACTLPNVFLGQAAIHLGLTGPVLFCQRR